MAINKYRSNALRIQILLCIAVIVLGGACRTATTTEKQPTDRGPSSLSDAVYIKSSEGDEQIFAAGTKLPATYSERFVAEEQQGSAGITISQSGPGGMEIIAEVDIPLPKEESSVVVTARIGETRSLYVKASVMESGLVKEFGPFPVR